MNPISQKLVCVAATALVACLACGCGQQGPGTGPDDLASLEDLGPTIGSLVRVTSPAAVKVEGYGLVSGLKGTGSAECPPRVRAYLARYIRRQLPSQAKLNIDEYINRPDTAVVFVEGMMPAVASGVSQSSLRGSSSSERRARSAGTPLCRRASIRRGPSSGCSEQVA